MAVKVDSDRQRKIDKLNDEQRRPLTGNRIVQEFTDNDPGRVVRVNLYENWVAHVEYVDGATGTIEIEATADMRADVNLSEDDKYAGNPEDNNWITIATTTSDAQIRESDETVVWNLARVNPSNVSASGDQKIRVTWINRQFIK